MSRANMSENEAVGVLLEWLKQRVEKAAAELWSNELSEWAACVAEEYANQPDKLGCAAPTPVLVGFVAEIARGMDKAHDPSTDDGKAELAALGRSIHSHKKFKQLCPHGTHRFPSPTPRPVDIFSHWAAERLRAAIGANALGSEIEGWLRCIEFQHGESGEGEWNSHYTEPPIPRALGYVTQALANYQEASNPTTLSGIAACDLMSAAVTFSFP